MTPEPHADINLSQQQCYKLLAWCEQLTSEGDREAADELFRAYWKERRSASSFGRLSKPR